MSAASLLVLLLTLSYSVSGFLFKRDGSYLAREPRPHHERLLRRYWHDDKQTCVEKQCSSYNGNEHLRCLFSHCPEAVGLYAAERDLSEQKEPSKVFNEEEFDKLAKCAVAECSQYSGALYGYCALERCFERMEQIMRKQLKPRMAQPVPELAVDFNSCADIYCSGLQMADYGSCIQEHCEGNFPEKNKEELPTAEGGSGLVRKRRVNEGMSLCIRNYCNDLGGSDRIRCIYTACQRG